MLGGGLVPHVVAKAFLELTDRVGIELPGLLAKGFASSLVLFGHPSSTSLAYQSVPFYFFINIIGSLIVRNILEWSNLAAGYLFRPLIAPILTGVTQTYVLEMQVAFRTPILASLGLYGF